MVGGSSPRQQEKRKLPNPAESYGNNMHMGGMQFGASPNVYSAPPPGVQPTKRWHGTQTTISMTYRVTYTNTIKYFDDLFYCYIYGYDVYHTGSHGLGGKRNKWGHN